MRLRIIAGLAAALCALFILSTQAADTLPSQINDAEYWKMISDFSEPDGYFQLEIITSNEVSYQYVLPQLARTPHTGAYIGVGPEQNFTYIAALQPRIAFLIDIRRDMMLEHLLYKAIFEMSADRADFVANLFARKRPAQLNAESTAEAIFRAYTNAPSDKALADERLKTVLSRLETTHGFPLSPEDENRIKSIYSTFMREGVVNFYSSYMSPGYAGLMTLTDGSGRNWSFLSSSENYNRVRAMQQKNLIVPLVGDFAGPKAIRTTGQYVRDHGAIVSVFYISNVEDYIQATWSSYVRNITSLPMDPSSVFIRWSPGGSTRLSSMPDFVRSQSNR